MTLVLLKPVCESNPIVYLDVNIGEEFAGRIIIELRKDVVPKTAENFRALCTGEKGIGTLGKPLHFKGIRFHKVTRVFVAQSGDVVNNDGTSGESIYGPIFEDECYSLLHEEGVVSMANYGRPHTNNSQFVITSVACDNLNGTHIVTGKVLRGLGVVGDMEKYTTDDGEPKEQIVITDCGEIAPGQAWGYADDDETDDKLPPYPQDWERKADVFTVDEVVAILTSIRYAGNHFYAQQRYIEARRKYRKAERYYLLLRNRLERSKSYAADAKSCDVAAAMGHLNMAAVELKLGEYESAKYVCTEAIRLDPNFGKAYYRRGNAHLATNNYEEAIHDLKEAHRLLPENKQIVNELNRAKKLMSNYNRKQMTAFKKLFD